MASLTKLLAGTLLGAGVIAGYSYLKKMRKTQDELEIISTAKLQKLSWDGIAIRVNVLLKNPTKGTFNIKFPFVKILYQNTTVGSSQVVDKPIKIPPYGQAKIDDILISIPVTSIFSLGYSVVKSLEKKEPVVMQIKVMTEVDLGWKEFPYEKTSDVVIKK